MACPSCGAENRPGNRFCSHCGGPLELACADCGTSYVAGDRFCGGCGAALPGSEAAAPMEDAVVAPPADVGARAPETEVRLLSVLFLDLVGFTTLSEERGPEELRELLDRYFDRSRRIVERYGGSVAKYIGDAIMAVWGSPIAHDDDAERSVRAALDLVDEVAGLGEDEGIPGLRARAGVTTGRVAVTVGAEQEGMVVGDRVNTASRLQSAAAPGTVLVDDATKRATSTAISYEDAGAHDLKGKNEAVTAWRAMRVVARRAGAVRAQGLEPPFVGRERELRLVRDVFEAVTDQGTAAMVAVIGQAGIGKSRLAWEFEKHLDGLVQTVYWHRGRCLAYGEAVSYNALAEMVRLRADIGEDEDQQTARRKLVNAIERHVPNEDDRAYMLPRLAQLLGLEERSAPDQADLFSAWRLFFEHLADAHPVVLLFEDLQWADRGLLDFIDHLLDWSRDRPLLVIALARPEVIDRVDWGARVRNLTTIHLDRLSDVAMEELLAGLVPGLPEIVRDRIAQQAEGIPLYAVETVRMLLDRGQVLPSDEGYVLAGPIDELDVPETLQTLVAARLDGLDSDARETLQHAAVFGQSFNREAVRAMCDLDDDALEEGLRSLRAKDLIGLDAGSRSPESGHYTFLQAIVRTVAYETLSRHERKRRHLAAARHLEATGAGDELADVVATHYLDAHRADPDASDADAIRADALRMLRRAADRAESLAALDEAQRCCDAVAELTDDAKVRAEALLRAGSLAHRAGNHEEASRRLREAAGIFRAHGDSRQEALAEAWLARVDFDEGRAQQAVERLSSAVDQLDPEATPVEYARLAAEFARHLYFLGRLDECATYVDEALRLAERERLLDVISDALNTKALVFNDNGHAEEALALMRHAYALGERVNYYVAMRAMNNMTVLLFPRALWDEVSDVARSGLERARRDGDRDGEQMMLSKLAIVAILRGHLQEAAAYLDEAVDVAQSSRLVRTFLDEARVEVLLAEGNLDEARQLLQTREEQGFADEQERIGFGISRVDLLHRSGEHRAAVDAALALSEAPKLLEGRIARVQLAIPSAIALGDLDAARVLRDRAARFTDPSDLLGAAELRLSDARIAAAEQEPETELLYRTAIKAFDDCGMPVYRATAELELAACLLVQKRAQEAERLLDEVEPVFADAGARLELDHARKIRQEFERDRAAVAPE